MAKSGWAAYHPESLFSIRLIEISTDIRRDISRFLITIVTGLPEFSETATIICGLEPHKTDYLNTSLLMTQSFIT